MGSRPQLSRIWLAAAVLLVLAGWPLTGSPALAAPRPWGWSPTPLGRASADGLASACHGEGMGVETELWADDPLVFTMETSPN